MNNNFQGQNCNFGHQNNDFQQSPQLNVDNSKGWFLSSIVEDNMPNDPPVKMPFNWGAGLWSWVWAIFNGQAKVGLAFLGFSIVTSWLGIGLLIPLFALYYFGAYAGELAWAANPNLTKEQYDASSKKWLIWGVVLWILMPIVTVFLFFGLGALFLGGLFL